MITKKLADIKPGEHFMTYTQGMRGWFAVEMWMNNKDFPGDIFAEPWVSDDMTYRNADGAKARAKTLADTEDLPYVE